MGVRVNHWCLVSLVVGITFFFSLGSHAAPGSGCADGNPSMPNEQTSSAEVPGDRWMEIDLYWFEQADIAGSVSCFWDRFAPLYKSIDGDRGLILNIGWTVGYIMEWTGEPEQRIS